MNTALPQGILAAVAFVLAPLGWSQERYEDVVLESRWGITVHQCGFYGQNVEVSGPWMFIASQTCIVNGVSGVGRIEVYKRTETGFVWYQDIEPSTPTPSQEFSLKGVESFGNTLFVAASGYPSTSNPRGAVFIFEYNGNAWVETGMVDEPSLVSQAGYADELAAVSESEFLVGAAGSGDGEIYVYEKVGGVWGQVQVWTAPGTPYWQHARTGRVMRALGSTMLMVNLDIMEMTVFRKDVTGYWDYSESFSVSVPVFDENHWSLDFDGQFLAIGMDHDSPLGNTQPGAVVIVEETSTGWVETQIIRAPDNLSRPDEFGRAVDLDGNLLIVGAPDAVTHGGTGSKRGAAYVFERDLLGQFQFVDKLVGEDTSRWLELGYDVALSGSTALVGDRLGVATPGVVQECLAAIFDLPMGESVCPGVVNSTGASAKLEVLGSAVAEEGYLRLRASHLPVGLAGVFLGARSSGLIPNPGGSHGNLCLGGAVARFNRTGQYGVSGLNGEYELQVDASNIPFGPGVSILAGQTWTFQLWYRDMDPLQTTNFSDAVEVVFD